MTCKTCKIEKSKSEFYPHSTNKTGIAGACKSCQNAQSQRRRESRRAESRAMVHEYLSTHPCVDCGISDPRVLEFDHVRGEKVLPISIMIQRHYWSKIILEIEKCEVRCANCHRIRTHSQLGFWGAEV